MHTDQRILNLSCFSQIINFSINFPSKIFPAYGSICTVCTHFFVETIFTRTALQLMSLKTYIIILHIEIS